MVTGTGGGPSGPGGARKVRNQRATAASSSEMPASSISLLWVSGRRVAIMARVKTTAKNTMPLSGTIENAMPASVFPSAAERYLTLTEPKEPKNDIDVA